MHRAADVLAAILTGVALVAACGEPAPEPPATMPEVGVAVYILTNRATQGYRRVFPDDDER